MSYVTVHCCTWNVGDEGPPDDDLASFLGVDGSEIPDVVCIGLQEVISGDMWRKTLIQHLYPLDYVLIKTRNCWAIWIFTFVKRTLLVALSNIESEVTASGYAGVMGNKGGVSVRFELFGVNIIFLSCHFTAHMENKQERLNDYLDIIQHQSFRDSDVNVILDHDYVFWMGDLNFRIDGFTKAEVEERIREGRLQELLEHDQLLTMKKEKLIFQDFMEGEINFPPTFKFDKGTDVYDSSKKQRVPAWTDRIFFMSHCDFAPDYYLNLVAKREDRSFSPSRSTPIRGPPSEVEKKYPADRSVQKTRRPEAILKKYVSLPQYKYSDHRPVIATFKLSVPPSSFGLPVKFEEPLEQEYSIQSNLPISYKILNPPHLLQLNESSSTISNPIRHKLDNLSDFTKLLLLNTDNRLDQATQPCESGPVPPPTLQTTAFDWIGLYPAEFSDLQEDCIAYIYARSSVPSKQNRNEYSAQQIMKQLQSKSNESSYTTRMEAKYLRELSGQSVCLIYMSRNKNCPQGYSPPFKLIT